VIHDKIDGGKSYSIVPVGAPNSDMIRATFWIKKSQKQMPQNFGLCSRTYD